MSSFLLKALSLILCISATFAQTRSPTPIDIDAELGAIFGVSLAYAIIIIGFMAIYVISLCLFPFLMMGEEPINILTGLILFIMLGPIAICIYPCLIPNAFANNPCCGGRRELIPRQPVSERFP